MTDIFQEVEEDLRRERLKRLWDRFGLYVIAAAVLVVVVTAGWRGWVAWETARERAAGERFAAALADASGPGGAAALQEIADGGPAGYALLARFRLATAEADAGETEAAVAAFRAIAQDGSVDDVYRDLARVRAGQVLLDAGDPEAARAEVAMLAERQTGPFTFAAREVTGLAAWSAGDLSEARRWFEGLEGAGTVPADLRGRARLMLTLIDGALPRAADGEGAGAATDTGEMTQ